MTTSELITSVAGGNSIFKGRVNEVRPDGVVLVDGRVVCQVLETAEGSRLDLQPGEDVLVLQLGKRADRGIVLGRVAPWSTGDPDSAAEAEAEAGPESEEVPEEVVIEATQNLTFKCGGGSITLRKDGKILIKGQDLVSHARRMNRVKGGAVSIN